MKIAYKLDTASTSSNDQEKINSILSSNIKFNIERVEKTSGAFNQGKIFLTINKELMFNQMRAICDSVTKSYSNFSNLTICIYDNSPYGIEIAKGKTTVNSSKDHNNAWLAMYTFNPVEGAYFDDSPTRYQGGN